MSFGQFIPNRRPYCRFEDPGFLLIDWLLACDHASYVLGLLEFATVKAFPRASGCKNMRVGEL